MPRTRRQIDPASRLRTMKLKLRMYLFVTTALVLLFVWLGANALLNNHYRNDPGTQTISATVTSTKQDCTKSGCYYDSYGNYNIYGTQERDVKVVSLSKFPVISPVTVLVNPKRPQMAMPYYYNPYPAQAIAAAAFGSFFILWNSFLYFVLYRRSKRRLLALIACAKPTQPFNPIS